MYARDHNPPHYHVVCGEHEAVVLIAGAQLLYGSLPRRERRLVLAWHALHGKELVEAWARGAAGEPVGTIDPLP